MTGRPGRRHLLSDCLGNPLNLVLVDLTDVGSVPGATTARLWLPSNSHAGPFVELLLSKVQRRVSWPFRQSHAEITVRV